MSLEFVNLGELTERDIHWLIEITKADPNGYTAEDAVTKWSDGDLQFWRFSLPPAEGMLVTIVEDHPAGRELLVYGAAGKGILIFMQSLQQKMEEIARGYECKWIKAQVTNLRLSRPYMERLGYQLESVVLRKEV